jgi:hypothetical protein
MFNDIDIFWDNNDLLSESSSPGGGRHPPFPPLSGEIGLTVESKSLNLTVESFYNRCKLQKL